MVAQADRVAGVLPPVPEQAVGLEVAEHGVVDDRAGHARPQRVERDLPGAEHVVEQATHLVRRVADDQRPLELGVVAPDRGARLGHEHVAGAKLDVVRDGVRPGAPPATGVRSAGGDAVRRRELPGVAGAERGQHCECRLVSGAQRRFGLGRART